MNTVGFSAIPRLPLNHNDPPASSNASQKRFGHSTVGMATEGLTMGIGMGVGMRLLDWLGQSSLFHWVANKFKKNPMLLNVSR